ncbi:MAG: DUF3168 domain-containing protein [Hyphomicrobiales bacterium]|nr:MAG: DUF3168 domain-containing protein [Hyphomicrobiales bacterium]
MTHPSWALQKAVYETLSGDPTLIALLGGVRIHDGAPRGAQLPFVALDPVVTTDGDGDELASREHRLSLVVWTREGGKRQALAVLERLNELLHDADLTLDAHRLINLRRDREEVRQNNDRRSWRGELRLRAVTEPLA